MNYKHLGFVLTLFVLNCAGMDYVGLQKEPQEMAIPTDIPEKEYKIYQQYFSQQRANLSQLLMSLGNSFSDEAIPQKRKRKLQKALTQYYSARKNLLSKAFISAAFAAGSGYCAQKGCTIPETTAAAGVISAGCGLLTINYLYDWYCVSKPSYESIAQDLEQKIHSCPDWRRVVARKIEKMCLPTAVKEHK